MTEEYNYDQPTEEFDSDMESICEGMNDPGLLHCSDEEGEMLIKHNDAIKAYKTLVHLDMLNSGMQDLANFLQILKKKHLEYLAKISHWDCTNENEISCRTMLISSVEYIDNCRMLRKCYIAQLLDFLSELYDKLLVYC